MTEQAIPGPLHGKSLSQTINRFAIWASVGIFGYFCWLFFGFTADDSYIVARYGRNLAENGLLQYNLGEPINALTSPLHGLIMAGLSVMTTNPVLLYKILAATFSGLAVLSLIRALPVESRGLGAIAILTSPFLAFWGVGGLETPILLGLVAILSAEFIKNGEQSGPWVLIIAALMFLTRFDSALFTAPAALAILWANRASGRYWVALAGAVVLAIGWLLFAKLNYGTVLPTSYFLKGGNIAHISNIRHIVYLISFLVLCSGVWIATLLYLPRQETSKPALNPLLIRYGFCLIVPYFITMASVHMMFSYRALIPYLPALIAVLVSVRPLPRQWTLAIGGMTLAINLGLAGTIVTTTINPSIAALWTPSNQSPEQPVPFLSFEYTRVSISDYRKFTNILEEQAKAMGDHWRRGSEPWLLTTAAGVTPWYQPKAHVMEQLVSYRPYCDFSVDGSVGPLWRSADYIQLYQDSAGVSYPLMSADDLADVEQLEIVHETFLPFDMVMRSTKPTETARVVLFHNPAPTPHRPELSQKYFDACRLDAPG